MQNSLKLEKIRMVSRSMDSRFDWKVIRLIGPGAVGRRTTIPADDY